MSDFDFDALRDPVAPEPGAPQRAGVDARARVLRGRARRSRLLAGAAAVVAVAAIATGVVAATRSTDHTITIEAPATTTAPSSVPANVAGRFIPPQRGENGTVVMPVTLPDGERFVLSYPPAMKIAQLGFAGTTGINGKLATISYQKVTDAYGGAPVATLPGVNGGTVSLFHANQRSGNVGTSGDELAYQFGPWLAVVAAPASRADQHRWAAGVWGTVDTDGYLVLHAQPPLTVGHSFEGAFGKVPGNSLQLASNLYCGQPGSDTSTRRRQTNSDGSEFVSWCAGTLHVTAEGTPAFLDQAEHDLQITLPGTPTTTTTTTRPIGPPAKAVSASWVSPTHGWVLQARGSVAETTDGGATWRTVGSLGPNDASKIRFADASHGFALEQDGGPGNPLFTTADGGVTWAPLDSPFTDVFDVEVSRGVVYAVAMQASDANFRIWSSPADQLRWLEDPLVVPVGAGPVPSIQLVFSGTSGWLVEIDRVVAGGARLLDGQWAQWAPPCSDKMGPAELAASSSQDLIATCDEHAWGGGPVDSALYVSHDAGTTFTRRSAPAFGAVASPRSPIAVGLEDVTLQRTTDNGRTWDLAYVGQRATDVPSGELGFTTSTQGFAIISDGKMIMTHDAGASWQPVTLP